MFRAKVTSALLLDELTRAHEPEVFALFSSASAAVGNPGQGTYAAANAVLDALAERRRPKVSRPPRWRTGPGTARAWPAASAPPPSPAAPASAARPDLAVLALRQVVTGTDPVAVVADVDPDRFARAFTSVRPSRLLAEMPSHAALAASDGGRDARQSGPALRERLTRLPEGRRATTVLTLVRERAAKSLGHPGTDQVGPDRAFRDLGFDSLGAVELRNQLNAATGLTLSATLVFDTPPPPPSPAHPPAAPAERQRRHLARRHNRDEERAVRAALAACPGPAARRRPPGPAAGTRRTDTGHTRRPPGHHGRGRRRLRRVHRRHGDRRPGAGGTQRPP
ncbi:beta-ketoacyl reductase [Streptomyces sp. SS52]|uniref:beta-ketoacyl reductase n=1 Tax=Streptomyces sp. SS52 TaxID=2563602 RepID=UPI00109E51CC|nr:beta-ketoacyl reductase [Streptomyces sp. SS52]QCB20613.1 KR domain-containing protein [Streptomyces sp. SS52]